MIQLTFDRLTGLIPRGNISVVSPKEFKGKIKKHLGKIKVFNEPEARNTMGAICLSAWNIGVRDPEAIIAVFPSDAYIADTDEFRKALSESYEYAALNHSIVCLGIKPTFPATGYGYIESGAPLSGSIRTIERFVEKPNESTAEEFFKSGSFIWNAGIFIFKAQTFFEEVETHAFDFFTAFETISRKKTRLKKIYSGLPKESIDTALMEKTRAGVVMSGDFGWNDIGSWPALQEVLPANSAAGLVLSQGGFEEVDSSGIIASIDSKKFLGVVGLKDIVIVETKDAILVCSKDKAQEIKTLVSKLQGNKKFKKLF